MDRTILSYNRGRLVCIYPEANRVRLSYHRFYDQQSLTDDGATEFETDSDLRPYTWSVLLAEECIDLNTGIQALFLIASRSSQPGANEKTQYNVFRVKWKDEVMNKAPGNAALMLTSYFDISDENIEDLQATTIALTNGPAVLFVHKDVMWFMYSKDRQSKMDRYRFSVSGQYEKAAVSGTPACNSNTDVISTILACRSDEDWTVVIVLQRFPALHACNISNDSQTASFRVLALERHRDSCDYRRKSLVPAEFIPQAYASKVSTVNLHVCRKHQQFLSGIADKPGEYENCCIVGLNDGYVAVFMNGVMKVCVSVELSLTTWQPSAVQEVLHMEDAGVLVCHTTSKDCFLVCLQSSQVVHHWPEVQKCIVGDFLQNGGQQLLLVFQDWLPQQPGSNYLLTDLQGFVIDKRFTGTHDDSLGADPSNRHQQHAFTALQEQNQAVCRTLREEKQRLERKQAFVLEYWCYFQNQSLGSSLGVQRPEIPLMPLLCLSGDGSDQGHAGIGRDSVVPQHHGSIQVKSVWHRIVHDTCVIGVNIVNTSERDLRNLNLVLSPGSSEATQLRQQCLSGTSKIWQSYELPPSTEAAAKKQDSAASQAKRQKLDHRLCIQQTTVVHPTDSATVTCSFSTPPLGIVSAVDFLVHLQVSPPAVETIQRISGQINPVSAHEESPKKSVKASDIQFPDAREKSRYSSVNRCDFLFSGQVTLKASELLQQDRHELWNSLMKSEGLHLEAAVMALSATQECWNLHVAFILNKAAILPACFQKAGLIYQPALQQYVCSEILPPCLSLARIVLTEDKVLSSREAKLQVLARDSSQLLLLLQLLYSHLPEDAHITVSDEEKETAAIKNLTSAMSAELMVLRTQSRAVVKAHKLSLSKQVERRGSEEMTEEAPVSETEDFSMQQRRYLLSHGDFVSEMDSSSFLAALDSCALNTDVAVARL